MDLIATDYIGVTLIAKTKVKAKTFASTTAPDFDTFFSGDIVGRIFSYVLKNATVWWMFQNANGTYYYVEHETGVFEWSELDNAIIRRNIINRGGDVATFDKEQRNKNLKSWGWKAVGFLAGGYITKKIIDKNIS